MAFTGAERARIRSLGGWPTRWFATNNRLELSLDALGDLPHDETQIRTYLTELTAIDALITEQRGMIGVKQTGSVVLTEDQGLGGLRAEGRRLVEAIASILGVEVTRNFYGGSMRGHAISYG